MTCEPLDADHWRLSFSEDEARFVVHSLAYLGLGYQEKPDRMSPALRAYWQGSLTAEQGPAADELKDSQEMLSEARAELRSERLALTENWLNEFELAESRDPWIVEVTGAEREEFVAMLNDRRMMLALEMEITDHDMESNPAQMSDVKKRMTVLEIDMLAHVILIALGPQIYRP